MKPHTLNYSVDKRIKLAIVDDSELFRKFIAELLSERTVITIIGEAANGQEAVELLENIEPDVVMLDMEMPVMDGMEVLRHIMADKPKPVIMVSGLSREGSARSYDALKSGAVDFLGKDALHPKKGVELLRKELLYRLICASKVQVRKRPGLRREMVPEAGSPENSERVVFCEECGTRNVIEKRAGNGHEFRCSQCGDLLDAVVITKYRRVSSIGVVGMGHGGCVNLLNIVPYLSGDSITTLIVVMHEPEKNVEIFSRYLNSISDIKVARLAEGMNVEGGNCYIAAAHDNFCMVSHSTNFTIRKGTPEPGQGAFDLMLSSLSQVMKNRLFAMTLSGQQLDGDKGMLQVKQNDGYGVVLNAASCLCKELGENILKKSVVNRIVTEEDCLELISRFQHDSNGNGVDNIDSEE